MSQLIENYLKKIQNENANIELNKWKEQLQKSVDQCKAKCVKGDKKCINTCERGKQQHIKHNLQKILVHCAKTSNPDVCKKKIQKQINIVDKRIYKLSK